ncbi:unnamed protein product [Allacma fusca]|uniref:Uncharacterized protein n=1 Tax=Allacma fusca TaxID=39272 RepID=A0A8J2J1W6_9HEXA|nr:unnamed protein product [Allacma fusca]
MGILLTRIREQLQLISKMDKTLTSS